MNISAMRNDWIELEDKGNSNNLADSVNRGTYTKEDIKGFFSDINSGLTRNEAGRKNNIPKGSVHHVYNSAVV